MAESAAARLSVDLDALAHNFHVLAREAAGAEVAPVLKADGYGLGAAPLAKRLWAEGARSFFVARLDEGEALRLALGPARPAAIHVLDGFTPGAGARLQASGLRPVLLSLPQVAAARAWSAAAGRPLESVLHVDTGMNRQGLTPSETVALIESQGLRGLHLTLIMSHLGSGSEPDDPRNAAQLAAFREIRGRLLELPASLAASAGTFLGRDFRFEMVRPGVSLFGGGPFERADERLQAVATLTAPILDIRNLRPGDLVGYGSRVRLERAARVAVLAAGYADGVMRAARGAKAWVAGSAHPILAVNMDLTVIEIGDAPAGVGDQAELVGPNAPIDDLARAAGTVAHEILVRLSRRAERVYLGEVKE